MPSWLDDDLADRRRRGLFRTRRGLQSAQGVHIRIRGRSYLSFASNDYLNLAADPRLARAAARAARRYGCGSGASPLVTGHLPPLRRLERDLARWEGTEKALVFSSGFAANLGTLSGLADSRDALFSDELNHASLIDGCRLARAAVHIYRHADVQHLAELLHQHGPTARRRFIVTDSVFSMDGDLAPLVDLLDLAQRHDARLVIDEAHATGVLGEHGRGLTELVPGPLSEPDQLIKIGTLSKGLGAQGGFVCGSRSLVTWLVNQARPYIFSTALSPAVAAAAQRAIAIVEQDAEPRQRLLRLAEILRARLREAEWPSGRSQTQIVPVIIGDARAAVELSDRLAEQGVLVPAIRPPSVPPQTARLRVSLTTGHTEEDVERLIRALHTCLPKGHRHAHRPGSD